MGQMTHHRVTFNTEDQAVWLAESLAPSGHRVDVDDVQVTLTGPALEVLASLPEDVDGHYDGTHVWIGGSEYYVSR